MNKMQGALLKVNAGCEFHAVHRPVSEHGGRLVLFSDKRCVQLDCRKVTCGQKVVRGVICRSSRAPAVADKAGSPTPAIEDEVGGQEWIFLVQNGLQKHTSECGLECIFSLQASGRVPAHLSDEIKPPAVVLTLLPSCKHGQPGSRDLESNESNGSSMGLGRASS